MSNQAGKPARVHSDGSGEPTRRAGAPTDGNREQVSSFFRVLHTYLHLQHVGLDVRVAAHAIGCSPFLCVRLLMPLADDNGFSFGAASIGNIITNLRICLSGRGLSAVATGFLGTWLFLSFAHQVSACSNVFVYVKHAICSLAMCRVFSERKPWNACVCRNPRSLHSRRPRRCNLTCHHLCSGYRH